MLFTSFISVLYGCVNFLMVISRFKLVLHRNEWYAQIALILCKLKIVTSKWAKTKMPTGLFPTTTKKITPSICWNWIFCWFVSVIVATFNFYRKFSVFARFRKILRRQHVRKTMTILSTKICSPVKQSQPPKIYTHAHTHIEWESEAENERDFSRRVRWWFFHQRDTNKVWTFLGPVNASYIKRNINAYMFKWRKRLCV